MQCSKYPGGYSGTKQMIATASDDKGRSFSKQNDTQKRVGVRATQNTLVTVWTDTTACVKDFSRHQQTNTTTA